MKPTFTARSVISLQDQINKFEESHPSFDFRFHLTTRIHGKPFYEAFDKRMDTSRFGLNFEELLKYANESADRYIETHPEG